MNRNSTSTSKESLSAGDPDALFGAEKPAARKRGKTAAVTATRIPDDFAIDDDMRLWAKEKIPGFDFEAETENFIDYWRQRADKGALKADWIATWRTWMRRAAKAAAPPPASPNGQNGRGYATARPGAPKKTNYSDEEYTSGW
jgi:hypothetical protein